MAPRLAACVLVAMFILPAISSVYDADVQLNLTAFGTGAAEMTLDFSAAGSKQDANLSLQTGVLLDDCTMNITGMPHTAGGKDYPANVSVDVGNDGDIEWAYTGTGYGAMGRQTMISNGSTGTGNVTFLTNETKGAPLLLPSRANITSAKCTINASPESVNVTVNPAGISSTTLPFNTVQTFRFQWLYPSTEIGRSGWVDKVSFMRAAGTGSMTFSNFRMSLCNTTVTALTTNFANNYGGATPVKVLNATSLAVTYDAADWIMFDVNDTFYYDANKNLIIEVAFTGYTGVGFSLHYTSVAAGIMRRMYNNTNDTATVGTLEATSYRCNMRLGLLSGFNMSVDIGNDTVIDYQNGSLGFKGADLQFTQSLAMFIATAPVAFTDSYGNNMVSVPLAVKMRYNGTVQFSNLDIIYVYNATLCINPSTGNITNKLNQLVPDDLGITNLSIPIKVIVESSGKVRLGNLTIKARPPYHLPTVTSVSPPGDISIFENTTLDMNLNCYDTYGCPLTYKWYRNGTVLANNTGKSYSLGTDYDSSGKHVIKVEVANGFGTVTQLWNITVRNVNRPPVMDSVFPPENPLMKEGGSLEFRVNATDPDGDFLRYAWFLNAQEITGVSTRFYSHTPDFKSAGPWDLRAMVMDSGGLPVNWSWSLTVDNVNQKPMIESYSPKTGPHIKETDAASFSVVASDPDGQQISYSWFLNGTELLDAGNAPDYKFTSNYDSAGTYNLAVTVSDGELNETRSWTLTVDNLNRVPVPAIEKPKRGVEFLNTDNISFSAKGSADPDGENLTYRWSESGNALSLADSFEGRFSPGEHEVTLEVFDRSGGTNSTSVRFMVRFVDISVSAVVNKKEPRTGDTVTVSATVFNSGDAQAGGVAVEFLVDGKSVERRTVSVKAGEETKETFSWTATKGPHKFTVRAGSQGWNGTVDVKPSGISVGGDSGMWLPIGLLVVLCALGAVVMAMKRKKRTTEPPAEPTGRSDILPQPQMVPGPVQPDMYQPPPEAQYTPPPPQYGSAPDVPAQPESASYRPQPESAAGEETAAAETSAYEPAVAPVPNDDDTKRHRKKAIKIINQVSELTASGENAGHDMSAARRALDNAMLHLKRNDFAKALSHAKRADNLARGARDGKGAKAPVAKPVELEEKKETVQQDDAELYRKMKKARSIVEQVTDYMLSIESSTPDMRQARRLLEMARAQVKAGNASKAISYAKKADILARSVRERERSEEKAADGAVSERPPKEGKCPDCGLDIEPGWKVCPGCRRKLQA